MKSKLNFKSSKHLLILVILILLIIFLSLIVINNKIKSINQNLSISSDIKNEEKTDLLSNLNTNKDDTIISYVIIPSISLEKSPIKEGIDEKTLNEYIGHFPSTSKLDGNIGLAAHNRGYKNNYFMNINKLQIGDEIIYKIEDVEKVYKVDKKVEIDSYDWSYLNQTTDNRITLITCIDDRPNKRLVVQAVE